MVALYGAILLAWPSLVAMAIDVTVPLTAPHGAPLVKPDLVSLSIEQNKWEVWAKAEIFYNALENLVQITNSPPFIRIGANSEDRTNFSYDAQFEEVTSNRDTYRRATNITVGKGFYEVISNLPSGTRVHWGVNLRELNLTAAYLETRALVQAFESPAVKAKGITLNFIEVGNEADFYKKNGGRNSSWSVFEYVSQWVQFATNVSETAGLSDTSSTKLIGGAFAGSSHNNLKGFSPQAIFADGILDTLPGCLITAISQHRYSGSFCTGSSANLQDLMRKHYIRGNISVFEPDIKATFSHGLEYILGETNSISCGGAPGVSNTAGAALWALDYSLFATQVGISRLHFHQAVGDAYNFIQPVTLNSLSPHIQPPYYAAIIAAEAIGSTGSAQVVEIPVHATDVSGYAIYEHGSLARAVFINAAAYLPSGGLGERTTTHINIDFSGYGLEPLDMTVKRLDITYADATSGITWGGQTYETADARVSGALQIETLSAKGLDIRETEVVLLSFL